MSDPDETVALYYSEKKELQDRSRGFKSMVVLLNGGLLLCSEIIPRHDNIAVLQGGGLADAFGSTCTDAVEFYRGPRHGYKVLMNEKGLTEDGWDYCRSKTPRLDASVVYAAAAKPAAPKNFDVTDWLQVSAHGRLDRVEAYRDAGIDVNVANAAGWTALDMAEGAKYDAEKARGDTRDILAIIKLLRDAGGKTRKDLTDARKKAQPRP